MKRPNYISVILKVLLCIFIGLSLFVSACSPSEKYEVYQYDNGDDYFSEGLQRIVDKDGKIGFRDSIGKIVIQPRYAFAFPFNEGYAKVTDTGHSEAVDKRGEYHQWISDSWYYIDTTGTKHPELIKIAGQIKSSADGSPLQDAVVTNNRTGKSSLSDAIGRFSVLCVTGDSLNISYVGLISQTIPVNPEDSTEWKISMREYGPIIEPMLQKSYSTNDNLKMVVVNPDALKMPVDSIVVEMINNADEEATFGEWFRIEKFENGKWKKVAYNDRVQKQIDQGCNMAFNDIGYRLYAHQLRTYANPTKAYNENIIPGRYRLSKTFSYPPYPTLKSDTAYVEFDIR